jgi:hypothetical protein
MGTPRTGLAYETFSDADASISAWRWTSFKSPDEIHTTALVRPDFGPQNFSAAISTWSPFFSPLPP